MSARNRELFGLFGVGLLVTAGFTAVFTADTVDTAKIGNTSLIYGGYFFGVCLAIHVVMRLRLPNADPYLFPLVALLAAFGLVLLFRIEDSLAFKQATLFLVSLGIFLAIVLVFRDYMVLERYRYLIAVGGILLLLSPRLLIDHAVVDRTGAYINADLGFTSFQPAELAKICVVIFLASYLRDRREVLIVGARRFLGLTLPPLKHLGPLLVVWGAAMLMLIFIRDLGSSLMLFGGFLAILYVATNRVSFVIIGMLLFLVGFAFLAQTVPHVQERVEIWQDPFAVDGPAGAQQLQQSLFAQANGGLFGEGLGQSLIELPRTFKVHCSGGLTFPDCNSILPAPHTDFIYAVAVDELGLFGGAAIICIYGLIGARGFRTAVIAPDGFSKLLAVGLSAVFVLQAFVIIGGVTQVIPLTGVTLPFISFGGSSVIANMILVALLLMISDRARSETWRGDEVRL